MKTTVKINYTKIILGGIALGSCVTFFVALAFNTMGIRGDSLAAEKATSKYPFELSASSLKKVNFIALDPQINSIYSEVRPFISSRGTELFFSRRNFPGNIFGEKDKQDIWVSILDANGKWSKPKNMGDKINSKRADAICSVSPDGSEIILFSEDLNPEKVLSRSTLTDKGWSDPEPMAIQNFYNLEPYIDFHFSYEANVLLMAVSRNGSNGEQDIYVSLPDGKNKWSEPRNLGPVVNSSRSDFAPFLAIDGKTLYYVSYGHDGLGGCDIYQTTRLDDTWTHWSKPKNLGEGINSPREESYFSISGDYKYIYFESYDLKNEVRDIFRADLPEAFKPSIKQDIAIVKK